MVFLPLAGTAGYGFDTVIRIMGDAPYFADGFAVAIIVMQRGYDKHIYVAPLLNIPGDVGAEQYAETYRNTRLLHLSQISA